MRSILPALAGTVSCAIIACTDLPPLHECGNGIVEPITGEDCDDGDPGCAGCRYACRDDGTCREPGYVCGVDEVCRLGAGTLSPAAGQQRMDTDLIAIADVDGDRINDMIGGGHGELTVVFGDPEALLAVVQSSPLPDTSADAQVAAIAFPDGVGIAAPTPSGVAIFISYLGGLAVPAVPIFYLDDRVLAGTAIVNGAGITLSSTVPDPTARLELVAQGGLTGAVSACGDGAEIGPGSYVRARGFGPLRGGVLVRTASSTCVRALTGTTWGPPEPVPLGPPVAWPIQLDGDACIEVAVDRSGRDVAVWDAAPPACAYTSEITASAPATTLIGTGDLDGDGTDEMIVSGPDPEGTWAVGGSLSWRLAPRELDLALVADVNRDGRFDVVGASQAEPDLTVALGLADGSFAAHRIATSQPISYLVADDIDGDTFVDVVAIDDRIDPRLLEDLYVHFGGPAGLGEATYVTSLYRVTGLAIGRFAESDSFADLLIAHHEPPLQETGPPPLSPELSQFVGTPGRLPYSPTQLDVATLGHSVLAGELVAGSEPVPDLGVLGVRLVTGGYQLSSWWLTDIPALLHLDIPETGFLADWSPQDPLPVFAPGVPGDVAVYAVRADPREGTAGPGPVGVLAIHPSLTTQVEVTATLDTGVIPLEPDHAHYVRRLRAIQLDADPESELVVALYDQDRATNVFEVRLYVLDRGPGAAAPVELGALAGGTCYDADVVRLADQPTLVAACSVGGAVAATDALYAIDLAAGTATAVAALPLEISDPVVRAGEVTGDGLEDVVIRDGSSGFGRVSVAVQCSTSLLDPCSADIPDGGP